MIRKSLSSYLFVMLFAAVANSANKQDEGKQLIARAIDLSDIRAESAPAFRMRATFQVPGKGSTSGGSYSEVWVSKSQWRREIETSDFRRLEVGQAKKRWLLDSDKVTPPGTTVVTGGLDPHIVLDHLKIKEITEKEFAGTIVRCVKSQSHFLIDLYCINPANNTLVLQESLSRSSSAVHTLYVYRDYEEFGNHIFPRTIEYTREGEPGIEIKVSEIVREASPDVSQFAPPSGALEFANCRLGEMTPPRPKSSPDPDFPGGAHANNALVVLSLIVGPDGEPRDIRVARSGGAAFDKEAARTVSRWRFEPSTCLGEPVAAQINVEVEFRR